MTTQCRKMAVVGILAIAGLLSLGTDTAQACHRRPACCYTGCATYAPCGYASCGVAYAHSHWAYAAPTVAYAPTTYAYDWIYPSYTYAWTYPSYSTYAPAIGFRRFSYGFYSVPPAGR